MVNAPKMIVWFFTYIVYPILILVIFGGIGFYLKNKLRQLRTSQKLRHLAGILVPIIVLTFAILMVYEETERQQLNEAINSINGTLLFGGGLLLGIWLVEFGFRLMEEAQSSFYMMTLSFIGSAMIFAMVFGPVTNFVFLLMGLILGTGAWFVVRVK